MGTAIPVYYGFARVAFLKILAYRLRYFTGILTYFINVSVYYFIWKAVFSGGGTVAGYDLSQMVTYVGVGWMTRSFYFNNIDRDLAAEVSEGKISINLIKPVDTQLMYIAQTAGEACFRAAMFTLPISVVLFAVYPIRPPASGQAAAAYVCSCFLSLLIFSSMNFLVGTFALHIQSILGVIRAKFFIVEFLSGLLVPLNFFPAGIRKILAFLPFPYVAFTPLEIYLGRSRGPAALEAIGIQLLWVVLLYAAGRLFWRYSTRRLSIQGG
jgi:ABC-2 type transport system permease protein